MIGVYIILFFMLASGIVWWVRAIRRNAHIRRTSLKYRSRLPMLLAGCLILVGCGKPPAPVAKPKATTVPRVSLVAGLGGSQFTNKSLNVATTIDAIAELQSVNFGNNDAYQADIYGYISTHPVDVNIGVGHSMGCAALCRSGVRWRKLILLDPAPDDFRVPDDTDCVVIRFGYTLGIRQSKIGGVYREVRFPKWDHNEGPHQRDLLDFVIAELRAI